MTRNRLPGAKRHAGSAMAKPNSAKAAPLPAQQLAFFERAFDQDFSQVRVHTGPDAGAFARGMGAKAVTSGDDIAFAPGRFAPQSAQGRTLLAHELAHVAQQREGGASDASESRARGAAQTVADGGQVSSQSLGGAEPGGLHCDPDEDAKKVEGPPPPPPSFMTPPLGQMPPYTLPSYQLAPPTFGQSSPPIDWLGMRSTFDSRGLSMGDRDYKSVLSEWQRGSHLLDTFGIDDHFKFLFITKPWLLNLGITKQLNDTNARDSPNAMDRAEREWKTAYPDDKRTPIIPIFDLDWFRKK